jgi:Flp pilus assembly protein TadG
MLRNIIARIRHQSAGTSTIEFAFVLPVLLFVFLYGGVETWSIISTSLRVNRTASHVAGVAARADATLDETALTSVLNSADTIASPTLFLNKGRVILSAVEGGPNGKILWQRCKGEKTEFTSTLGTQGVVANLSGNGFPEPPADTTALIAETYYKFQFSLFQSGLPNITLKHKSIALGREDIPAVVINTGVASNC